jgi:hypothetical protein
MNRVIALSLITILSVVSCNKKDSEEIKETIDTASHTLGRELDTLINTTLQNDSVYKSAPHEKINPTLLGRETFRSSLNDLFDVYTDILDRLAVDDSAAVTKQAQEFSRALMKSQAESASEKFGNKWRLWVSSAEKIASDLRTASTLDRQRNLFSELSQAMENSVQNFGLKNRTVYKISCSTFKQKNNFWLTDSKNNVNPYYGQDKSNEKSQPCIIVMKAWEFD